MIGSNPWAHSPTDGQRKMCTGGGGGRDEHRSGELKRPSLTYPLQKAQLVGIHVFIGQYELLPITCNSDGIKITHFENVSRTPRYSVFIRSTAIGDSRRFIPIPRPKKEYPTYPAHSKWVRGISVPRLGLGREGLASKRKTNRLRLKNPLFICLVTVIVVVVK